MDEQALMEGRAMPGVSPKGAFHTIHSVGDGKQPMSYAPILEKLDETLT